MFPVYSQEAEPVIKETYTLEGLIEYDEDFRKEWITHSQYGFTICMTAGFKKVAKMIAAHHARTDWGAIVDLDTKDLEPIYYLVHHLDDLSAKFGLSSSFMNIGGLVLFVIIIATVLKYSIWKKRS